MKAEIEGGVPDERKREGPKRAQVLRTVYVRRVVEREGVMKFPPALSRKASVHTATSSHFRHIEPSSGWVGYRRGEETAPCLGCRRRLPPEGGVRGSREETAPRLAVRAREAGCRQGRLGLKRPLRRCPGLRLKPLDQSWRGWTSIWAEGVGCEEALNG
jgi:hypothetical protein